MINKATVKYIQSLQHKKFRDEAGSFIAEGPKLVAELLSEQLFNCEEIFCTETGAEILTKTNAGGDKGKVNIIKDFELKKISALTAPNNILAVFKKRAVEAPVNFSGKLTLALDDIQDPGNLGTMIRIADWFGIKNMICSNATADCYNPKTVQGTMASLGRVNIVYGELKALLKKTAVKKYAAVLGGKDISSFGQIKEGIIIIGNESKGISDELLALADEKITIAKKGNAESLNAAVAAGIILFAIC